MESRKIHENVYRRELRSSEVLGKDLDIQDENKRVFQAEATLNKGTDPESSQNARRTIPILGFIEARKIR